MLDYLPSALCCCRSILRRLRHVSRISVVDALVGLFADNRQFGGDLLNTPAARPQDSERNRIATPRAAVEAS